MPQESIEALIQALKDQWDALRTEKSSRSVHVIQLDLSDKLECVSWLQVRDERQVYWQSRNQQTAYVGLGVATDVACLRHGQQSDAWRQLQESLHTCDSNVRWYGGLCFNSTQPLNEAWESFGVLRFWVPRVGVLEAGGCSTLQVATTDFSTENLDEAIALIQAGFNGKPETCTLPVSLKAVNQPSQVEWCDQVGQVVHDLKQHQGKVVLSVKQSHTIKSGNPVTLFATIRSRSNTGFHYYYQVGETVLMGSSPECLYKRKDAMLTTEALAGTASQGADLLHTEKENCEHDFVIRDVTEALETVCDEIQCQPDKELQSWQDLIHLKTTLSGVIKPNVTDQAIIEALHPSAAVLGYPRDKAWQWLAQYESHSRGWYAGPIGWLSGDCAEFAVALRCALVSKNEIDLYAGAGLIAESQPDAEWQEVQNKMRLFNDIFDV